jgi:hypothetical protein
MTRRWIRERAIPAPESAISRAIVALLQRLGWRVYNFASNHALPPAAAGFADIVALRADQPVLFVQVKREDGGRLSPEQVEFADLVQAATGTCYVLARSVDDVLAALRALGAIGGGA